MGNFITPKQCAQNLRDNDNILIICHKSPDGDTLGSGFGLMRILRQMGKKCNVICSDEIPKKYSYMFVEEEQHFTPEYIVSVDIADKSLFGAATEHYEVNMAIDHHVSHRPFAKEILLMDLASDCEIIYLLAKELGVFVDKGIANCIYTGLSTDTGCFKYQNVTPDTMRTGAELIEAGAEFVKINRLMFSIKSRSRMALERIVLDNLIFFDDNTIAAICVTQAMIDEAGAKDDDFEGISPIPRQIEGVEVGILLREKEGGYKLSLRTGENHDASIICTALGGGGHKRAAGAFFGLTKEEALQKVLTAVREHNSGEK